MFFCFFFLYIYRTQSVDVKHERRSSTQQHRKNKRLIGVCRLRWSQDFWVDYEDISTEMTDAIQDEVIIQQPNFLQHVHDTLANMDAAVVSIDIVIDDIIPMAMMLLQKSTPIPYSVLNMLNRIATNGNQRHLEMTFESGIIHALIDGLPRANNSDLDLSVTILYNLAATGMKYWQMYIENLGVHVLLHWLAASNDADNMPTIVRLLGVIFAAAPVPQSMFVNLLTVLQTHMMDVQWPEVTEQCVVVLERLATAKAPQHTELIELMVQHGILHNCIQLIRYSEEDIVDVCLQLLVNVATVRTYNTVIIDSGVLCDVASMLYSSNDSIQASVIALVIHIVASHPDQLPALIDNAMLTNAISRYEITYTIHKQVVGCIYDVFQRANPEHIQYLIEQTDAVNALCAMLLMPDSNMIHVSLTTIWMYCCCLFLFR